MELIEKTLLYRSLITALLVAFLLPSRAVAAGPAEPVRRVVVVAVDGLTLADLAQYGGEQIKYFLRAGAVGLMSPAGQARSAASVAASLGAGAPVRGGSTGELAFNATEIYNGEEAGMVYQRHMGWPAPAGSVVFPDWPRLLALNEGSIPGALGEALHAVGLATAVIGNGDLPDQYHRPAAAIAADGRGTVDHGEVSRQVLRRQREGLLPWELDQEYVLRWLSRLPPRVALVVIYFGDARRLEDRRSYALPAVAETEKARLISRLDAFLAGLLREVDLKRAQVYLLGLSPGREAAERQNLLLPVLGLGAGLKNGLLTSATTRRPGLVASLDFAPSVLQFLGLPEPATMLGRPWWSTAKAAGLEELLSLNERLAFVRRARLPLVRAYVILQMVAMGLALLAFLWRNGLGRGVAVALPWLLIFLAATPLSFLLMAQVPHESLASYGAAVVVLGVLLTVAYKRFWPGELGPWFLLAASLVGALVADTAAGAPLQQQALLSYDSMSGARYYGIGNEYMGVLIGAALLAGGALLELLPGRWSLPAVAGTWTTSLVFLAAPAYGANVGGTIAAAAAFGLAGILLFRSRVSWTSVAGLAAAAAALVVAVAWWDAMQSLAAQSHLGRALTLVRQEGLGAAWDIIGRKLATNLRLIRYTIWTRVLLSGLAVLGVVLHHPVGITDELRRRYPRLSRCLLAMVFGSFVALIFNDSGIVAAATMMIYGIGPLLALILLHKRLLTKTPPGGKMGVD